MASSFLNPQVEGTGAVAVNPRAAISDSTDATMNQMESQALSGAASVVNAGLDIFQKTAAEKAKRDSENAKNNALATLSNNLQELEDDRSMGSISLSKYEVQKRWIMNQFNTSFPSLINDSGKIAKNVQGAFSTAFTPEEQAHNKNMTEFIQSGELPAQADSVTTEKLFANFMKKKDIKGKIAFSQAQVSLAQSKVNLESSQMGLANTKRLESERVNSKELINIETEDFTTKVTNIVDRFNQGGNPQALITELKSLTTNTEFMINSAGGEGGKMNAQFAVTATREIEKTAMQVMSGELTLELAQNNIDNIVALQQIDLLDNVKSMSNAAAAAKLLPTVTNVAFWNGVGKEYIDYTSQNSAEAAKDSTNPPANLFVNPEQASYYLDAMNTFLDDRSKGRYQGNEEGDDELAAQISGVMNGIDKFQNLIEHPKQMKQFNDLLSNPELAKLIKEGKVNDNQLSLAKQVWKDRYRNELVPAIAKEFDRKRAPETDFVDPKTGKRTPGSVEAIIPSQMFEPLFAVGGVEFMPTEDALSKFRLDTIEKLRIELNEKLAPTLYQLTKQSSHFDGNVNYEKVFNDVFVPFLSESKRKADEAQAQAEKEREEILKARGE
jgi:hypothetical protein